VTDDLAARGKALAESGKYMPRNGIQLSDTDEIPPPDEPPDEPEPSPPPGPAPAPEMDFWSSRPALHHALALARARGVGPWAVLGVAMARAITTIPPDITLPGTVGGRMSLNLFVALVGPSGGGKGAAEAAAFDGFRFGGPILTVPVGSGEGIGRTFRPVGTEPDAPNPIIAAIFTAAEIDTAAALFARSGSTLSAELRKMFCGEQLGFGNAGKDARNIIEAHTYRACTIFGVQPGRSAPLLNASDGGLPQRFTWLPTSDPDVPDDPPPDPGVWKVSRPSWLRAIGSAVDLCIPEAAVAAIRKHRLAVLREDPTVNALDGHCLLTRLKIAAAMMALDGRTIVSESDWALAGYVMDVSNYTRERCQRALAEQSRSANTARALASADREEIVSDRKAQRARSTVLRKIDARGQLTKNQLRMAMKADIRDYLDAAISDLLDANEITVSPGRSGSHRVHVYHRYMDEKQPSTSNDGVCTESTHVPSPADMANHRQPRQRQRTRGMNRPGQQTQDESA
jgi:hypothetical protein